jgi:DNA-binding NarL/FixJ family response regulator
MVAKPSSAMGLIEAAHRGEGDLQAWVDGLLDAARPLIKSKSLNVGIGRRGETHFEFVKAASVMPGIVEYWAHLASTVPATNFDAFWRFPAYVGSANAVAAGGIPSPGHLADFLSMVGARDVLGLVAMVDDHSLSIGAPYDETINLAAADQQLLTLVTLHVESGLRLRIRPSAPLAILRPDGRLLHAEGPARDKAQARERLTTHVGAVERGRGRRQRQHPESVQAWSALVSGNWGLVEREERGVGRHYAVLETTHAQTLRALSALETHAVELSARGLTGKCVAYALGVTPATVSKQLANAAFKLGLRNRTELVQLAARLLGIGPQPASTKLTPTERDVLALVRLGWTNARIAQERKRSERTVANQVSALLEKLAVPSRRALAATR